MILSRVSAEILGKEYNHMDSPGRKSFCSATSDGRKQEIVDSLGGS